MTSALVLTKPSIRSNTPPNSIHINYFVTSASSTTFVTSASSAVKRCFGSGPARSTVPSSPCFISLYQFKSASSAARCLVAAISVITSKIRVHSPDSRHSRLTSFSSVPPCLCGRCLVAARHAVLLTFKFFSVCDEFPAQPRAVAVNWEQHTAKFNTHQLLLLPLRPLR